MDELTDETINDIFSNMKKKPRKPKPAIIDDFLDVEKKEYKKLLTDIYTKIRADGDGKLVRKVVTIKQPQLMRSGGRRIVWLNFHEMCVQLNRDAEHIYKFILSELGTDGSLNNQGRLTLKGNFNVKQIETILKKYIAIYKQCKVCKSSETTIVHEPHLRMNFLNCTGCTSNYSVPPIGKEYRAIIKR